MKIVKIILVLGLMFISGLVSAKYVGVVDSIKIEDGNVLQLKNDLLTSEKMFVIKIIDNKTTCYLSYTKSTNYQSTSPSINCIK